MESENCVNERAYNLQKYTSVSIVVVGLRHPKSMVCRFKHN